MPSRSFRSLIAVAIAVAALDAGAADVPSTGPVQFDGHYYEVVVSKKISWEAAKAAAESRTHNGIQGRLAKIESQRPDPAERHLAVHYGHCTHLSDADRIGLAAFGEQIPWQGWVGSAEDLRKRAEQSAAAGTTELLYTPAGDDLIGEAERFYEAMKPLQDSRR